MCSVTCSACLVVSLLVSRVAVGAEPSAPASALEMVVEAGQVIGKINAGLLGVNHGPLAVYESHAIFNGKNAVDLSDRYKEIGVRSVRLDEFGAIDIQSLFPDFTADADKPESYRFCPADAYLKAVHDVGAETVFRMGYSEKPNRVDPPSDFEQWTKVMVQVVKHYNEGWANGYRWGIRHWEVWNEPSGLGWTGTLPEYCRLYETVVKGLKAYDPNLLVGGPTLGSPDAQKDKDWGEGFIRYCADRKLPLDFFSYHLYFTKPQEQIEHATRHRRNLNAAGFHDTKMFLTEWGWLSGRAYPPPVEDLASAKDAAADIAAMAILHDRVEGAHFYVGGAMADYPWGLFDFVRESGKVSARPRKSF
ncbi:MAG: hypothetical protein HZB26_08815 [Candidatus Hydrogenedentes bacterium]|nr:hypothetical protein [Candidatus Hydrogenedentota bacterium]